MKQLFLLATLAAVLALTRGRATEPAVTVNRAGAELTLGLSGDSGIEYAVEAASDLAREWNIVASFLLNNNSATWREPVSSSGARFFRARTVPETDDRFADNFQLLDQNGVARELYYYAQIETLKAIVLIFTEGNYSAFAPKIRELRANPNFADVALFWTIETSATATRAEIAQNAAAAGINWPVLHGSLQLVARDYGARFNGEVFLIRTADMKVVYRGLIDDAVHTEPAANAYLASALANVVESQTVLTTRVEPTQGRLTQTQRAVADYATAIAPLLQTKCVTCHSPGNIAPFALTSYDSVLQHGLAMKEQIMAHNMPPWDADPEYGRFKNDISLSPNERATLIDWLSAGMPRNGGDDPLTNVPPPPPGWPAELGPPDQIVTIPLQRIPATGTIAYRYIYARASNTQDVWLRAAVVRPSNRRVVHHYNVWEGRTITPLVLAAYSPGRTEGAYPEGTGWLLQANMEMTFNLHYNATGQEEVDQPELALWYTNTPPARRLQGVSAQNSGFSIPPGAMDYQVNAGHIFSVPVRLYMVNPHMHYRGSRMRFELTLPGTTTPRIIASIPRYDFHWQTIYSFDPPLDLPAGSRINVIGAFDNSTLNHHNPNPAATVTWGDQSWDEMFIGYMEYSENP